MCYGYTTEIPPLYTLSIYNAIANDGVYVKPRLVDRLHSETVDSVLPIAYMGTGKACSPRTARLMREMLTQVVWGDHGTGKMLRNDRVRIAGKTGTCYMIENGAYNTGKKRLAFCGFFPCRQAIVLLRGAYLPAHSEYVWRGKYQRHCAEKYSPQDVFTRYVEQQFRLSSRGA